MLVFIWRSLLSVLWCLTDSKKDDNIITSMNTFLFQLIFCILTVVSSMPKRIFQPMIPIVDGIQFSSKSITASYEDNKVWGNWIIKTGAIGSIIGLLPMPNSITFPMRLGVLTVIMAALVIESGTDKTSKSWNGLGESLGNGISSAGNSIGNGISSIGLGLGLADWGSSRWRSLF